MLCFGNVVRLTERSALRTSLLLTSLLSVLFAGPALAQCAGGGYATGESCITTSTTYQGCCEGNSSLRWCESGQVCVKNCASNPANSCCQLSVKPGCCDGAVMQQVCIILGKSECCTDFWGAGCITAAMLLVEPPLECPAGAATACKNPINLCGWDSGKLLYNCSDSHSGDPSGGYPLACEACTPVCAGKACGDDGCGGSCGNCPSGFACTAGACACAPACNGKACGADGCGGTCGSCPANHSCNAIGQCIPFGACVPSCSGKACGDDGCGGTCGTCPSPLLCTAVGTCGPPACTPSCAGKACGDDGCGGSCGSCTGALVCASGVCATGCTPSCDGKSCGDDGCGGTCGSCDVGASCNAGSCESTVCVPECGGRTCSDDGCTGVCGYCGADATCTTFGQCVPGSRLEITTCPPGEEATWDGCVAIERADRGSAAGCQASPTGTAPWALLGLLALRRRRRRAA